MLNLTGKRVGERVGRAGEPRLIPGFDRRLEQALRAHINKTLQIQVATFDSSLCDKIASMEKAYGETNQGLWHRLWYGMGDSREVVEAWIGLIPDAYGLSVVKTGVAVVFKVGYQFRITLCPCLAFSLSGPWCLTISSLPKTPKRNGRGSSRPLISLGTQWSACIQTMPVSEPTPMSATLPPLFMKRYSPPSRTW